MAGRALTCTSPSCDLPARTPSASGSPHHPCFSVSSLQFHDPQLWPDLPAWVLACPWHQVLEGPSGHTCSKSSALPQALAAVGPLPQALSSERWLGPRQIPPEGTGHGFQKFDRRPLFSKRGKIHQTHKTLGHPCPSDALSTTNCYCCLRDPGVNVPTMCYRGMWAEKTDTQLARCKHQLQIATVKLLQQVNPNKWENGIKNKFRGPGAVA